jgi:hypothetical protein
MAKTLKFEMDTGEDLSLGELIAQLNKFLEALHDADQSVASDQRVSYKVVGISKQSPYTLELEPQLESGEEDATAGMQKFTQVIAMIEESHEAPSDYDYHRLARISALTRSIGTRIRSMKFSVNGTAIEVERNLTPQINEILGHDIVSWGSVSGSIEKINVHASRNIFNIYPIVGPETLPCRFPKHLRADAVNAVDHYARVFGMLKYKARDRHPYEMKVERIEILIDESDLPSFLEMKDIAPDATGDQASNDFIKERRSDWS